MNQPAVLIVADDPEFTRSLMARWAKERLAPPVTVVGSDTCSEGRNPESDVAIVGGMSEEQARKVLPVLAPKVSIILYVSESRNVVETVGEMRQQVRVLPAFGEWADAAVLLSLESLRRLEAVERAEAAEEKANSQERLATLGRYMLDVRHDLGNALTSVLGNTELLLMDSELMAEEARGQLETVHAMSLRMHEILQRLSSLDKEMQFAQKRSHGETVRWPRSAVAGV